MKSRGKIFFFAAVLFPSLVAAGQTGTDTAVAAIKDQVHWINEMVTKGKISQDDANERLRELKLQVGELVLGTSDGPVAPHPAPVTTPAPKAPGSGQPIPAKQPVDDPPNRLTIPPVRSVTTHGFSGEEQKPSPGMINASLNAEHILADTPAGLPAATAPALPSPSPAPDTPPTDNEVGSYSEYWQALLGVAVSGASATDPRATFVADAKLDIPLGMGVHRDNNIGSPFSVSAYTKIGAMAQPGNVQSALSSTATSYFNGILNGTPDKIIQSFEVGGGVAWLIGSPGKSAVFTPYSDTRFTLNLLAAAGALTPLSPGQAQPAVYQATQQVQNSALFTPYSDQFNSACHIPVNPPTNPATFEPCYVALFPADQSQFFRYWGAGLRLKVFEAHSGDGHDGYRFPGNLDFTIGQNSYVTGGHLHGWVTHFGGTFPIPKVDYLYLNLAVDTQISKPPSSTLPLLLAPGTTNIDPNSIVNVQLSQPFRDRWSVGLSFDLDHLISAGLFKPPDAPSITSPPQSGTLHGTPAVLTLSVIATGSGTLSYQWYSGSQGDTRKPVPDCAASTCVVSLAGNYFVRVTNAVGNLTRTTDSASVAVN